MTKNNTLKGFALGAIVALGMSGLVGVPANAAGLADTSYITLKPSTGTEYTVLAATGATFSLVANEAATVNVGNLKFLVSDPSGLVEPTADTTAVVQEVLGTGQTVAGDSTTKLLTVATTASPKIGVGERITFTSDLIATASNVVATASPSVYTVASVGATTFSFNVTGNITASFAATLLDSGTSVKVLRSARSATANTYVVNTGVNNASLNETLVLSVDGSTTRVVEVTAWKDANGNDKIDDNEYASPVRTITFVKPSDVVATTALSPIVGDKTLSATVTTVPVLNGQQVLLNDADVLDVEFTRQGSSASLFNSQNTVTWNDDAKTFTAEVILTANEAGGNTLIGRSTASAEANNASWSGLVAPATSKTQAALLLATASNKITLTQVDGLGHNLNINDKVTLANAGAGYNEEFAISAIPSSSSFTLASATASPALTTASYTVTTYDAAPVYFVGRVFAGTYTAQAYISGAKSGVKLEVAPQTAISDTVEISTVGSASIQGKTFDAVDGANDVAVKTGTLAVAATAVVYDADGDAVGAGRPVEVSFTGTGDTFKVNAKTGTHTVLTDANGAIALAVTSLRGTATSNVTVNLSAEGGAATASIDFVWADASIGLYDMSKAESGSLTGALTRTIAKGGSTSFDFLVADQWFTAPAADTYRLVVTGNGTTEGVKSLVDGKGVVTITDNGLGVDMSTTIALQKVTSGVWGTTTTLTVTTKTQSNPGVVLGASGSSLYGSAVVLSSAVAAKALVEIDTRTSTAVAPAYANNALLNGKVVNASTNVAQAGAEVVISGPSNILFESGAVSKRGSITVLSDTNGLFQFKMYSTTAQIDSVITVASMGKSSTAKVTFTGIGVGEGTSLVITAPETVAPASTLQIKAKLTDAYGNAVQASAGRIKMTYTGAGIGFGTLPDATDKNGELSYSVLLGAGDTGTITVVVSYDQNGDGDFVDAKDLNTTKTITVGAAAPVASSDAKVNAGSFKGYVALYAKGYEGQKMTAKVAGKWLKVDSLASGFERVVRYTGAGYDIVVEIYIDGELEGTFNLTTK